MTVPTDWWKDFFTGVALDMWRRCTTEELTRAEADFIEKYLGLRPPARVLDVPCGGGRHTLELARRGYRATGVDLAVEFIDEARTRSGEQSHAVTWEHRDMRDLPWRDEFDGAFSFGNSFGYLDDAGNADFLKAAHGALKPGGHFLIDAPTVAEAILPNLREREWFPVGDILFLAERCYDPARGRVDIEYTFVRNGIVEKRPASYRVYTYRELCRLLREAGFAEPTAFGSMGEEPFRLGSPGLFVIARRPA